MMRDVFAFGGCRSGIWKLAILAGAAALAVDAAAGAMAYSVTMLPRGEARLLTNRGDVVLYSNGSDQHHVWSVDGNLRALPVPENVDDLISILDMNDAGQVVANYNETNFGPRAVVFEPDGQSRELLPTGSVEPTAQFITNSGFVYGTVMGARMQWPPGSTVGVMYQHVRLPGGLRFSSLCSSEGGDMAGRTFIQSVGSFLPAVLRNRVEIFLPTGSRSFGIAGAMSEDGRWVGGWLQMEPDDLAEIPVRWHDDLLEEMPRLKGFGAADVIGINNDGVAVGVATGNQPTQATIWDAAGVPHLVADVVQTEQAWHFESAVAINNSGQVIGNGYAEVSPGVWEYRGYLLTPIAVPEPGGVLGLALIGAWAMRRRGGSEI